MGDESTVRKMAIRQRQRLLACLMGAAERAPWWGRLTNDERKAYRDEVLAAINPYHEFMLDLIGISAEESARNEAALALLEQVHASQRRLEQSVRGG